MRSTLLAAVAAACVVACPAPALAAKTCSEPGRKWERATPAEAGMDARKLQEAVDFAMSDGAQAFRIYRRGCLVAENASAPEGTRLQTQSWSMAKGISSVAFGRAWTLGHISPDDPIGALLPEADEAHGRLRMRDLLTMSAGNRQSFLHDFNITMNDRVRDALTVPLIHPPGEYYNYWQSGVALADEAVQRAVDEDFQLFLQREVLTPIGIAPGTWSWYRDPQHHTQGFFGVLMTADDYARFGDLMRRGGMWRGRRLLSEEYVRRAVEPTPAFGCYAWYLWVHASRECDGRSGEGNVKGFDEKLFEFNGMNQQLVTVFPKTDIVMVRVSNFPGRTRLLYEHTLAAVADEQVPMPRLAPDPEHPPFRITPTEEGPAEWLSGVVQPELPPAGPARARAVQIAPGSARADAKGRIAVALTCPPRLGPAQASCAGTATLPGASPRPFDVAAGATANVRFRLAGRPLRKLRRTRTATMEVTATTRDATAAGTVATRSLTVAAPRARRTTRP